MANVHAKVLVAFSYKGENYKEGDEVTMDAKHVAQYERLDYIKVPRDEAPKVEAAEARKEKQAPAKK